MLGSVLTEEEIGILSNVLLTSDEPISRLKKKIDRDNPGIEVLIFRGSEKRETDDPEVYQVYYYTFPSCAFPVGTKFNGMELNKWYSPWELALGVADIFERGV